MRLTAVRWDPMMPARVQWFLRASSEAYLLFAVAFALHCAFLALRDHYTVPHFDDWRILGDMFSRPFFEWVFTDQNGHHIPVTLLLLFLDYTFFSGKMHLLVVAGLINTGLAVIALYFGFRSGRGLDDPIDRAGFAFVIFGIFWAGSSFDFYWGANQGSQLGLMWTTVSLASIAVYQTRAEPGGAGARLPVTAGLAAFAATFSHGVGAASWGALNTVAVLARLRWRWIVAFLMAMVAAVALYSSRLRNSPMGSLPAYGNRLRTMTEHLLEFWTAFLGSPIAHVAAGLGYVEDNQYLGTARIAGAAGFLFFVVYLAFVLARRRPARGGELLSGGFMAFSIAGGLIVAVNRLPFPSSAVSTRFLTWSTPFWMGVVVVLLSLARRRVAAGLTAILLLWILSLSMVPSLREARARHESTRWKLATEAAMHLSGVRWDALGMAGMAGQLETYPVADRLRRDRRSFFADGRGDLLRRRVVDAFDILPADHCRATVGFVREIDARDGPAVQLSGYAWDRPGDRPFGFVLSADRAGIIRGLGPVGAHRGKPKVAGAEPPTSSWTVFVNGFNASDRYTIYAVIDGGREVCPLATWPRQ